MLVQIIIIEKLKIENISEILGEIALQELQNLPLNISECSICKMPEIGFLLCLPFWKPSDEMTENDYKIQNLDFKVSLLNFRIQTKIKHLDKYILIL